MVLFAGAASADWNEVMDVLERASGGTKYDVGAKPGRSEWVATRKARFENERARLYSADLRTGISDESISCGSLRSADSAARCE
jgi:hypothetical protein